MGGCWTREHIWWCRLWMDAEGRTCLYRPAPGCCVIVILSFHRLMTNTLDSAADKYRPYWWITWRLPFFLLFITPIERERASAPYLSCSIWFLIKKTFICIITIDFVNYIFLNMEKFIKILFRRRPRFLSKQEVGNVSARWLHLYVVWLKKLTKKTFTQFSRLMTLNPKIKVVPSTIYFLWWITNTRKDGNIFCFIRLLRDAI